MKMREKTPDLTMEGIDGESQRFIDRTESFEQLFKSGIYRCAHGQYNDRKTYEFYFPNRH